MQYTDAVKNQGNLMLIGDTHCDTLNGMLVKSEGFSNNSLQIDYQRLMNCNNGEYLQFFAVFESPSIPLSKQKSDVIDMINLYHDIVSEFRLQTVLKKTDLSKNGLKSLLSIEGLYFTDGSTEHMDYLFESGVRCISLTWNSDNEFSGGVGDESQKGLTSLGEELVKKLLVKGILIDVSHITDKGFWDIKNLADEFKKPFAATHSNVRKLCRHIRNLDDKMLKAIADSGGVTGINMYSCFLNENCNADINDVIEHIEYISALSGPEYVCFGGDFDGIDREKSALPGPESYNRVLDKLLQLNYTEDEVKGIAGENIVRVLSEVLE